MIPALALSVALAMPAYAAAQNKPKPQYDKEFHIVSKDEFRKLPKDYRFERSHDVISICSYSKGEFGSKEDVDWARGHLLTAIRLSGKNGGYNLFVKNREPYIEDMNNLCLSGEFYTATPKRGRQ